MIFARAANQANPRGLIAREHPEPVQIAMQALIRGRKS
jgi:hypothetical protein